jgi:hypothetical protein
MEPMHYSNPRLYTVIDDWPYGHARTTATFAIEQHPTRGERGVRTTIDPKSGRPSKPKALTYARHARIVDGDDGRTYIMQLTTYGTIYVMKGDMHFEQEYISIGDPRYADVLALFDTEEEQKP